MTFDPWELLTTSSLPVGTVAPASDNKKTGSAIGVDGRYGGDARRDRVGIAKRVFEAIEGRDPPFEQNAGGLKGNGTPIDRYHN